MIEFLPGVDFKLGGDVHVLRAREHLGINHIGDDRLVLASKVFVQELGEAVTRDFGLASSGFRFSHLIPPLERRAPV